MIVSPSRATAKIRVGLLVDPHRFLDERGRLRAYPDDAHAGVRVFAPWELTDRLVRAGEGEHLCWGEEPIRWRPEASQRPLRPSDTVVLRYQTVGVEERALLSGLKAWRDWLWRQRAQPGWSMGGSSFRLLKATLQRPLLTAHGQLPPPRWTLGGRQQAWFEPGRVLGAVHVDLAAAYPRTLGRLRYGGAWRRLDRPAWTALEQLHRFDLPLLVQGEARLDGARLEFGPLPRRPRRRPTLDLADLISPTLYPLSGRLTGMWTFEEVRNLLEAGGSFRCRTAFAHNASERCSYPFRAWLAHCERGRTLDDRVGRFLAKATAAALWGQFVIDRRQHLLRVSWRNGHRRVDVVRGQRRGRQRNGWDIGELVTGQVRAELWRLMQAAGRSRLVCVHTDGGWLEGYDVDGLGLGPAWRRKDEAIELQLLDQTRLRWQPPDRPGRWRYTYAGVPASQAPALFEQTFAPYRQTDAGKGKR